MVDQGCHMTHGSRNMIYMHIQWAENQWCLRSHGCVFLRSHYLIKTCHRMSIMYCIIHDVAVGLWDWRRHVVAVHGNYNHNLYRWYDWYISRCYTIHGKDDMFLLFLVVSFIEVYQLNKGLFKVVKLMALFQQAQLTILNRKIALISLCTQWVMLH